MNLNPISTIGHSTHSIDRFLELLTQHEIAAVADVRSVPASRYAPQFNREALRRALEASGIRYVFLGKELGARSSDPRCYVDGKVQYACLARSAEFASGIDRLVDGASRGRIAIMCTEQEPLECHRTVLLSRVLTERGLNVSHIHGDGAAEPHQAAMMRLRQKYHLEQPSLIDSEQELLARALELRESEIAYVDQKLMADV